VKRLVPGLLALLAASGCAKVGPPLPPLVRIPAAVAELEVRQVGYSVVLSWTNPKTNLDGSPVVDLAAVHVFQNGRLLRSVRAGLAGQRQSETIPVNDALGVKQTYMAVVETGRGKSSEASKAVSIEPVDLPGRVRNLRASVDQYRIRLTWDPPDERRDLAQLYNVRRSDGGTGSNVSVTEFEDRAYKTDATYTYRVTAQRLVGVTPVPAAIDDAVAVTAVDKTAPAPPAVLPVIFLENRAGALVTWSPNMEADLAGYRVYRGPSRDGPFTVAADKLDGNTFTDAAYQQGVYYAVTALDDSGNESVRSVPPFAP
jgi:fibronectin type 3 domain-containing protein